MTTTSSGASALKVVLVMGVALMAVSCSAIFIRLCDAPPLAIAAWRNVLALGVLIPWALLRGEFKPSVALKQQGALAGVFLAAHFALWITSLSHTSVAASVVLVCTQPIFVAVFAHFGLLTGLRERVSPRAALGIAVALSGAFLIGAAGGFAGTALKGSLYALGGAVTVALYVLVGRKARTADVPLLTYVTVVYAVCAVLLIASAVLMGVPLWGYSASTWGWLCALAVGPQILGHTLFNWALAHVSAPVLSVTILTEPLFATALAFIVLDERPEMLVLAGAPIVLIGLFVVISAGRRPVS